MSRRGPSIFLNICLWMGLRGLSAAPPALDAAVEEVASAVRRHDHARVAALAARGNPDPWTVADALVAGDSGDAGSEFAAAAKGPGVEALLPAVRLALTRPRPDPRRQRVAAGREALAAGRFTDALATTVDVDLGGDVASVLLREVRADALQGLLRREECAVAYQVAAEVAESIGWWGKASFLRWRQSSACFQRSDYPGALKASRARLELETRLRSEIGIGRARYGIGTSILSLGSEAEAVKEFQAAVESSQHAGDLEYAGAGLASLAALSARRGDVREALALYGRADVEFAKVPQDAEDERFVSDRARIASRRASASLQRATVASALGDVATAREGIAVARRFGRERSDHGVLAEAALLSGAVLAGAGQRTTALSEFEEAEREAVMAGDRAMAADALGRAGAVRTTLGDAAGALASHRAAVAALAALGSKRALVGALRDEALCQLALGDLERARARVEEAAHQARGLEDRELEADVRGSFGAAEAARGHLADAANDLTLALELAGPTGPVARSSQIELAGVRLRSGNVDGALSLYVEVIAAAAKAKDGPRVASATRGRALALIQTGRGEEAQRALADARASASASNDTASIAAIDLLLGDLASSDNRRAEALALHRRAAAGSAVGRDSVIARLRVVADLLAMGDVGGASTDIARALADAEGEASAELTAYALAYLTRAQLAAGSTKEAIATARRTVAMSGTYGRGLADDEAAAARSDVAVVHEWGAMAALAEQDDAALLEFAESGRAAELTSTLGGREALKSVTVPAASRAIEDAARTAEAMASAAYREVALRGDFAALRVAKRSLDDARDRMKDVISRLERESKGRARLVYPRSPTVDEARSAVRSGEAVVLYVVVVDRLVAVVVEPKGVRHVELGLLEDVASAVREMLPDEAPFVREDAIAPLRAKLIDPLRLSGDVKRFLVSPDGPVDFVPFSLIAGEREVVSIPSLAAFSLLSGDAAPRGEGILGLGDPDYGDRSFPRIAETRKEIDAVADVKLLGRDATEGRLRDTLGSRARWRSVHLACHGLADLVHPMLSSLAITADAGSDGLLSALDVSRLPVSADLAVLSACNSAKGVAIRGEGVLGLPRAFLAAGAPRVICSLWKVDDDATRALMTRFYELWSPKDGSKGVATGAALRAAQDFVRTQAKWKHPYYWAAWELWGLPS